MQLSKITIHNFRSIKEITFDLTKYALLVGENNSGKTNIATALRIFYEDGIKYDAKIDFPKFTSDDNESWIELEFTTSTDEQDNLKKEYQSDDGILKVRKYLQSDTRDLVKPAQSNIYAYEGESLSTNLFYGAKNISQAKLGSLVFIPELSKTEDSVKMSGPSPLRDMIDFVMKKVVKSSATFSTLQEAFTTFNTEFREEASKDGFSLTTLIEDINSNIRDWGIEFGIDINPISSADMVKNLISHHLTDKELNNQRVSLACYGQGLQRHIIYTLIRLSAKYVDVKEVKKKEWSPDFTLILFEEPEAFLHPSQQELLNISLNELAQDATQQILATTHSPLFVSRNVEQLPSLLKVRKADGKTMLYQISTDSVNQLHTRNSTFFDFFSSKLEDENIDNGIKQAIRTKRLGGDIDDQQRRIEEEALRYFLWLDSERTAAFFAKHVIICEGACEKVLIDHLLNTIWPDLKSKHIYCLDAMGKYNTHRYMNLFGSLGISHSVLYDADSNQGVQALVNEFLESQKNNYTKVIDSFEKDLEHFLGVFDGNVPKYKKPLHLMWKYTNGDIVDEKISAFKSKIEQLI